MKAPRGAGGAIPLKRAAAIRLVVGLACGLLLIALSVSSGAAALLSSSGNPAVVRLAPWDARALGGAAGFHIDGGSAPDRGRAVHLARAALRRDPTTVAAWRAIAIQAAITGNSDQATRLMRFSEQLSRRDLATQLWLIEDSVRRNDVGEALSHYDHAVSTGRTARDLLLPNLAAAVSQPGLTKPVEALVSRHPNWLPDFLFAFGRYAQPDARAVEMLVGLRRAGYVEAFANVHAYPARLADAGEWRLARAAYLAVRPPGSDAAREDVGVFAVTPRIAPFEWTFASTANLSAEPDGDGLLISGSDGERGTAASRYLTLRPGAYRLRARVSSVAPPTPARALIEIACAGEGPRLLSQSVVSSGQARNLAVGFVVPASCAAQSLRIEYVAADGFQASDIRIEKLSLARAPQPRSNSQ